MRKHWRPLLLLLVLVAVAIFFYVGGFAKLEAAILVFLGIGSASYLHLKEIRKPPGLSPAAKHAIVKREILASARQREIDRELRGKVKDASSKAAGKDRASDAAGWTDRLRND